MQECINVLGTEIMICREDRDDGFTKILFYCPLTQDYRIQHGIPPENKKTFTTIFLPRAVEIYNEL